MDNLPNDPSNPNNGNNNNPPPPFGSGFNPHTNPIDPNNPYQTQPQPNPVPPLSQTPPLNIPNPPNLPENLFEPEPQSRRPDALKHEHYSEAAQNKPRDEHGHFIHTNPPNSSNLPKLYSALEWEITQSKTLLFTSGKRRIEQEGVYLQSIQVTDFPQAFLDYYTNQLTNTGFKQTFNSSEPTGITITFAKEDLFLTFGVKNVFSGSGDNKKIVGYKAFIEHN